MKTSLTTQKNIKQKFKVLHSVSMMLILIGSLILQGGNTLIAAENKSLPSGIAYKEISKQIENYVQQNKATTVGLAVSIFDAQETIDRQYFGVADKKRKIAVDRSTVFEWGSATKILVWTSVMQLYEQGKIELDYDIKVEYYHLKGHYVHMSQSKSIGPEQLRLIPTGELHWQDILLNM